RTYSSVGCRDSLPVKAITPLRPTSASMRNDHDGFTRPRSSFFAVPSTGCIHSETRVPSLPPTRRDLPSGAHSEQDRQRSMARVTHLPSPPDAGATQISLTLFGSSSRGYQ